MRLADVPAPASDGRRLDGAARGPGRAGGRVPPRDRRPAAGRRGQRRRRSSSSAGAPTSRAPPATSAASSTGTQIEAQRILPRLMQAVQAARPGPHRAAGRAAGGSGAGRYLPELRDALATLRAPGRAPRAAAVVEAVAAALDPLLPPERRAETPVAQGALGRGQHAGRELRPHRDAPTGLRGRRAGDPGAGRRSPTPGACTKRCGTSRCPYERRRGHAPPVLRGGRGARRAARVRGLAARPGGRRPRLRAHRVPARPAHRALRIPERARRAP